MGAALTVLWGNARMKMRIWEECGAAIRLVTDTPDGIYEGH